MDQIFVSNPMLHCMCMICLRCEIAAHICNWLVKLGKEENNHSHYKIGICVSYIYIYIYIYIYS